MTRITLQGSSLLSILPSLLPSDSQHLQSQHEACAALVHAINSTLGFQLVAVDETSVPIHADTNVLPSQWSSRAPEFTLKYRHPQGSTELIVVKVIKLSNKTLIHAGIEQSEAETSYDFLTAQYFSPSYFPSTNESDPLIHGFVSGERLDEFITQYLTNVVKQLTPEVSYEGGENEDEGSNAPLPVRPRPGTSEPQPHSPLAEPPRNFQPGQRNPYEVGRDDLDPFAGRNPYAPGSIFPSNPGGGMYVGPNHPIFNQPRGGIPAQPRGPWGGDGFLPPMGAPPGARFDPVGPFGGMGGFPPGGPGRGRGRGGHWGGEPDNDEFMPPGNQGPSFGGSGGFGGGLGGGNMYM